MGLFDADDDDSSLVTIGKLVLGVAMTVAVPFMAYVMIKNLIGSRASNSWPQAQATITRFEIVEDYLGRRLPSYQPKVEYRFSVDGKDYSGSRLAFGVHSSEIRSEIEELGVKYAPGTQHAVYYDPADLTQSVIERGTHWLAYVGLVVPLAMLIVGPFMIKEQSAMLRRRASRKKPSRTKSVKKRLRRRPSPPPEE